MYTHHALARSAKFPLAAWLTVSVAMMTAACQSAPAPRTKPTSATASRGCRDPLRNLIGALSQVTLVSCKSGKGQVRYRARYQVAGRHAAAVEAILARKAGLRKLQYRCCGWEASGGHKGQLRVPGKSGNRVAVFSMRSQETRLRRRSDWSRIPVFYVTVEILEI